MKPQDLGAFLVEFDDRFAALEEFLEPLGSEAIASALELLKEEVYDAVREAA